MASFAPHEEAPSPRGFRRGQGLTGRVAETGEPIIFENVKTDSRYQELSQTKATQQRDHCFFALFPIKAKERFLGTITCLGKEPRKLIAEEVRLINSMCDQIGVAVENINLFEQVRSKTAELESSNSELREALEQQTATSEILRVIASSPTDFNRCWKPSPNVPRGFAARKTPSCGWSIGTSCAWRRIMDRCPLNRGGAADQSRNRHLAERWSIGKCPHRER